MNIINIMRKFLRVTCLFLVLLLSCACDFPDKLPEWTQVNMYSPEKLRFQETTLRQFKTICPDTEIFEPDSEIAIATTSPSQKGFFELVNVGFRNEKLDWLEFKLGKNIALKEFLSVYGLPKYIDTKYSDESDYYNYGNFSISTDKDRTFARSITIFGFPEMSLVNSLREKIPKPEESRFFAVFPWIQPGVTTEREFAQKYPDLLPYMEGEFDTNSTYTMINELEGAAYLYEQALLKFENGLLAWVSLTPHDSGLQDFLEKNKLPYKIEKLNENFDFYIFENFALTVDRHQKSINSIGVVSYNKSL